MTGQEPLNPQKHAQHAPHLLNVHGTSPPWRKPLEQAIASSSSPDCYFVSLATIKPFGRPANRTIFFRGFMTDTKDVPSDEPNTPVKGLEQANVKTPTPKQQSAPKPAVNLSQPSTTINPDDILSNVLVFVTDARSGSVRDILHGSRFGEVCWFFPETREEFRLSGSIHLVLSPTHPLHKSHQVAPPFSEHTHPPKVHWEQLRRRVWSKVSANRRASFAWPQPGVVRENGEMDQVLKQLPCLEIGKESKHDVELPLLSQEPESYVTSQPTGEVSPQVEHYHKAAWNNFALLLLEVDGADHLNMARDIHTREKYRLQSRHAYADQGQDYSTPHKHIHRVNDWMIREVNP